MSLESKRKIRLDLSYDGTDFEGWQIQKQGRTVQGELVKVLESFHPGQRISLVGSGRTDSGVHASCQVAHFETEGCSIPSERFRQAINSKLPRDIRIHKSCEVDTDFHARYDAVMRVYRYYLIKPEYQKAHMTQYSTLCLLDLDIPILNNMAMALTGTQDFTSFAAAKDPNNNKVRTIRSARFFKEGPYTVFRVAGNAFLWKMVRTMVGTLLQQYENSGSYNDIKGILEMKDRTLAGPSAKPHGLFLDKVIYGSEKALY
ncbi:MULTISPECIES: tRNA pseudouridine(38-40) synthase TruA [unclassified Oceanispirochaeta]|uniref:tRNA pseudouridine(38-40) synthase TruA n=1 Tax=unclassified Oceanispirochaeta TaxID=2635722 RepID=UPI000E09CAF1|nr:MULTISPECIES: tRNA pseudouridine(38-40) synthase TruA [unclassified Oceanispirochaeta]MBF9016226.1 tRNA pseudouridine(38-40) synthase TruA [Oceanispirochaeta sp. M2]NPD72688.1 tRNA pseudouridine(38-40) synthase TruA [Oceanispirochaeta sp. M1]RDG31837.1 tRNA pseudouridine(38-40) synthase TruA [Oceanispirochaeta sp. M1]